MKQRILFAAIAAMFATSAAMAAVNNLESYHFRHDFSTGSRVFIGGPNCPADFITDNSADSIAVEGPNGPGSAMHIGQNSGPLSIDGVQVNSNDSSSTKTTNLALNTNAWTLAMSFRPGNVEKGMLFSVGRLNGGASSGRIAVTVCSSSDPSKLYLQEFYRGSSGTVPVKGNSVELTGLGNMTNGFHTLVMVYSPSDKTITPYVDGTKKTVLTLSSNTTTSRAVGNYFQYGSFPSITGDVTGFSRSYTNTDVAFYDLRFYLGMSFSASDATAYAALYPLDRMGSPFRPNAYIEAGGTNTISANVGNTIDTGYKMGTMDEVTVDFQYLDLTRQARIFGMYNGSISTENVSADGLVNGLYINGSDGFAFCRFSSYGSGATGSWATFKDAGGTLSKADRIRRVLTVKNKDGTTTGSAAKIVKFSDRSDVLTGSSTLAHSTAAQRNTYLFANNEKDSVVNQCVARIYSFAVDGTNAPAMFLAPGLSSGGAAGFIDVVARGKGAMESDYFKGERNASPAHPLRFYNGVGCASDYKYENDTLYAKLYATSAEGGTVSVAGSAAAASAEGWIPRGGTLALSATPPENKLFNAWIGDTWAIADGFSATDASIEVSTPYATQLRATFKPAVPALLTIAANGADAVNWSVADWRNINNPEETITAPVDKNVTIVAHKSFTLTLDMDVALSNLTVQADANCVVTLVKGDGSLVTVETIVESGVLKQGTASVLGTTPKVTVKDGGTFDLNGNAVGDDEIVAGKVVTEFRIAGAGAGNYPWALTSSADMTNSKNVSMLYLDADATIGGANALWLGVRFGAGWNSANKNVNLGGHTLTKTGSGNLNIRRPYSGTDGGTLAIGEGTCTFSTWGSANDAYGKSCVSNLDLVAAADATVINNSEKPMSFYFNSIEWNGGAINTTAQSGADGFGVCESLAGHGTTTKFCFTDGATATLDGNLTITGEFVADGALALTRKAGVETNVTVAVTGTLTASGAITVGAGVLFDIGVNRPTGSFTVDDDATLVLRQASIDDEEIVVNVSAQPQNIVLYDINGVEIQNPGVNYDGDAGTVTLRAPTPVWTNTDGSGLFNATANWSSGAVPGEGRSFIMSLDGDTTVMLNTDYVFGSVQMVGSGSVGFGGEGTLTLGKVSLTNNISFATCGRVTVAGLDLPTESAATLTTLDGIAAGGVTGVGTLELTPVAAESVTIGGLSSFAGDFSVTADHSMTGTLTCAATKFNKFTLNGTTNVVFTLVKGTGGSFKASSEVVVAGGVLQQGSDNVLGTTPKITVLDGGTFDINAKTIRQETPIYIAGAGAGNWPWALASSSGAMAIGNYLYDLYLTADATTGAGQLKIGQDGAESFIYLNGHTLTAKSWLTLRNVNTKEGTINLQNSATLNKWNNLNTTSSKYTGTTLIIYDGHYVQNNTDRKIKVSNLIMHGGSITDNNDTK